MFGELRQEVDHAVRLSTELGYFCEQRLYVRPKEGGTVKLIPNFAQQQFISRAAAQWQATGKNRLATLKCRQNGQTTISMAALFWRTFYNHGSRAMVMAHRDSSADNALEMVRTFHANMPEGERPPLETNNATQLRWKGGSGFDLAIAAQDGSAGRGQTAQHVVLTEIGSYASLKETFGGVMQILPNAPGTTCLIEGTASEVGSQWHDMFLRVQAGDMPGWSSYFVAWHSVPEYSVAELPEGFELSPAEREMQACYKLTTNQAAWYRAKLAELMGDQKLMAREYPSEPNEAWFAADSNSFLDAHLILHAMKRCDDIEPQGELCIGVDVARFGNDASAICWRRNRVVEKIERRRGLSVTECAGWVKSILRNTNVARCVIDIGGVGGGVFDILNDEFRDIGILQPINFGSKATEPGPVEGGGGYLNLRSQMWANVKKALESERFRLPDDPALMADLLQPSYKWDAQGRLVIESKIDQRRRGCPSTDMADSLCLTLVDGLNVPVRKSHASNFNRKIEYPDYGYA